MAEPSHINLTHPELGDATPAEAIFVGDGIVGDASHKDNATDSLGTIVATVSRLAANVSRQSSDDPVEDRAAGGAESESVNAGVTATLATSPARDSAYLEPVSFSFGHAFDGIAAAGIQPIPVNGPIVADGLGVYRSLVVTAGSFSINLQFDTSTLAAPAFFFTDLQQAATLVTSAIHLNSAITVNITIGYNEHGASGGGALGGPSTGLYEPYSTVRAALIAGAAPGDTNFNSLPNGSSIQGASLVAVWNAQLKAFGLLAGNNSAVDGVAYFGSGIPDALLVGVGLHELTHALGRVPFGDASGNPDIFDLFRFTSVGNRLFDGSLPATASSYLSVNGGTTDIADYGVHSDPSDFLNATAIGSDVGSPLTPNDAFNQYYDNNALQTLTSVDLTQIDVLGFNTACYCRGTMILTEDGEVAIEDLAIGDKVMTASGAAKPIKWVGRRAYDPRFIAGNRALLPICLEPGALADGVPSRDLFVSPEHALVIDGLFLPARLLVNGGTIRQIEDVDRLEYFHIELEKHEVIFADGVTAETFIDVGGRQIFHNAAEFAALYPDASPADWQDYAALLELGNGALPAIRSRLLDRASSLGRLSRDPDLHLIVDGEIVRPRLAAGKVRRFGIPAVAREIIIASRSVVPMQTEANSLDPRRLGVPVEQIALYGAETRFVVGPGCPALCDGFHGDEGSHRWTDGHGELPSKLLGGFLGEVVIDVRIGPIDLHYPIENGAVTLYADGRMKRQPERRRDAA